MTRGPKGYGFSLIELLVVVAIVGILAGFGGSLFVSWRADTAASEAARAVQSIIAVARSNAKTTGGPLSLTFADEATSITIDGEEAVLPRSAELVMTDGDETVTFEAPFGGQVDFELVTIQVETGQGRFLRTSTISIIPPLGTTAVVR